MSATYLIEMRLLIVRYLLAICVVQTVFGDIQFQNVTMYETAGGSTGVTTGDFDGDGDIDFAISNRGASSVTCWYNNGSGAFVATADFQTGDVPRYVESADFDHDGDIDLCTADFGSMTTTILENDGDGNFAISQQYELFTPAFIWVDDFDMDGNDDIGVLHWDEEASNPEHSDGFMTPLYGNGDGTFEYGIAIQIGKQPRGGASADLNGDGLIDVVVADIYSQTISIVLASGTKEWDDSFQIPMSPGAPRYIALGDFDGDNDIDISAIDKLNGTFWILLNDGNANFALSETVSVHASPHSLLAFDVDDDSDLDCIIAHVGSNSQLILYNDGSAQIESMQVFENSGGAAEIKIADFNNDSLFDIVTANINQAHPGSSVILQRACNVCDEEDVSFGDSSCPPESFDIEATTDPFTDIYIELHAKSEAGNPMNFVITELPSSGSIRDVNDLRIYTVPYYLPNNVIRYFPSHGVVGVATFSFVVNDCLVSNEAEITVFINPPFPDECNTAQEVFNGYLSIATEDATSSVTPFDDNQCSDTILGGMYRDVWLKYVACSDGELSIDACTLVNFDSDIVIYEGGCCGLNQIACNGNSKQCSNSSAYVTLPVQEGHAYFVRIGGYDEESVGDGFVLIHGPDGECTSSGLCLADLQIDGEVNVGDLLVVISQWSEPCGTADLNVDGIVDIQDLLLVIGTWGPCDG